MFNAQSLFSMPIAIQSRWASPENWVGEKGAGGRVANGRKGSPCFPLKSGEQRTLAEVSTGSGTVRRIWMTINDRSPAMLRGLRLDVFWDGADVAAVSVPVGDFFGHALGQCITFESALFSSPEGRSFNCNIPMPFRRGMKITLTNESSIDLANVFYDIDYTVGDAHGDDTLYFHTHWRRAQRTQMQQDYEVLPAVQGRGRFLGMSVGVAADVSRYGLSWWGEGEIKMYLDGDQELPTLCGTGVEDYVGNGWAGNTEVTYAHRYQGFPINNISGGRFAFYRYHIPDPIYFAENIRVAVQQIGAAWMTEWVDGMRALGTPIYDTEMKTIDLSKHERLGLFEREDDWSSCAYFYLDRPTNNLPTLASSTERIAGL